VFDKCYEATSAFSNVGDDVIVIADTGLVGSYEVCTFDWNAVGGI
jgi:hypothetical protein